VYAAPECRGDAVVGCPAARPGRAAWRLPRNGVPSSRLR